jgi:hypothetical protein
LNIAQIQFIMTDRDPNTDIKVISTTSVGKIYPSSSVDISFDYTNELMIVEHLATAQSGPQKYDNYNNLITTKNPTAGQIEYWDFVDIHCIVLKGDVTGNSYTAGKNP